MSNIVVEVLRPLLWLGVPVPAGRTLKVDALQAQHLIDSGRAQLVHGPDAAQCQAAVRADVAAQLRASGAARIGTQPGPWRPL
jgi:hypothetical protein